MKTPQGIVVESCLKFEVKYLFPGYLLLFVVVVKLCQSVPIATATQQPITSRPHKDCFPSGFEFAYNDVIDHGNFPNGETCWQITCGPSGRLIKSLTPCEKVMTQRKPTAKPSEEKQVENQCIFNARKFNPGTYIMFNYMLFI